MIKPCDKNVICKNLNKTYVQLLCQMTYTSHKPYNTFKRYLSVKYHFKNNKFKFIFTWFLHTFTKIIYVFYNKYTFQIICVAVCLSSANAGFFKSHHHHQAPIAVSYAAPAPVLHTAYIQKPIVQPAFIQKSIIQPAIHIQPAFKAVIQPTIFKTLSYAPQISYAAHPTIIKTPVVPSYIPHPPVVHPAPVFTSYAIPQPLPPPPPQIFTSYAPAAPVLKAWPPVYEAPIFKEHHHLLGKQVIAYPDHHHHHHEHPVIESNFIKSFPEYGPSYVNNW